MLPIANSSQICFKCAAKQKAKVAFARGALSFTICLTDILSRIKPCSQLGTFKLPLRILKDITTPLVLAVASAEVLMDDFWNEQKTSFDLRAKRITKVVYTAIETFVIVPCKLKLLDCPTPSSGLIVRDIFVISNAIFSSRHASKQTDKQQLIQAFYITRIALSILQISVASDLVASAGTSICTAVGIGIIASKITLGALSVALTCQAIFRWIKQREIKYPTLDFNEDSFWDKIKNRLSWFTSG